MVVPVTWFQVVNRVPISHRYSSADSRLRRGRPYRVKKATDVGHPPRRPSHHHPRPTSTRATV